MSWRNWCHVSVSGCRDQLAHWCTTWGPALSFQHGECSSLSPQGGHFLLCGDLTFPGLLRSLLCVLLLSSKLYPRVCNFWKLLSHITTDNPFCLDSSVCLYLSFSNVTDFLKGSVLGHVTISPLPWGVDVTTLPKAMEILRPKQGTLWAFLERFKVSSNKGDILDNKWEIQCF